MITKDYKCRIYPNKAQKTLLAKNFNYFLGMRKQDWAVDHTSVGYGACSAELIAMKRDSDFAWLAEADSPAMQSAHRNLGDTFNHFFEGRAGYPRFHSKKTHQNIYIAKNNSNSIWLDNNCIRLPP